MAQPFRKQDLSVRLFALLVRALPPDFRMRHGSQMVQTFQDCWRDLVSRGGLLDLARFWRNTFADLLLTALILHTERFTMPKTTEPAHFALLIRPWLLFHRVSATRQWLARFRPYPKPLRKPIPVLKFSPSTFCWAFSGRRNQSVNMFFRVRSSPQLRSSTYTLAMVERWGLLRHLRTLVSMHYPSR